MCGEDGRMRKRLQVAWICVLLPLAVHARQIPLTILFTSDVNGRLVSADSSGGLLQCAALTRAIRAQRRNVLLLDCGDAVHGSFVSAITGGAAVRDAMEEMEYDACVPGRSDFDSGIRGYKGLFETSSVPVLAANIHPPGFMRPFLVKEIDGIRVVVVGLACPVLAGCHLPDKLDGLQVKDSVSALADIMPLVRQMDPDVVILATHQAWQDYDGPGSEINAIVRRFPEIDVILGGRRYRPEYRRLSDSTVYAQAGSGAHHVGMVDIVYDNVSRTITSSSGLAHPVTPSIRPDQVLQKKLARVLKKAQEESRKTAGCLSTPLAGSSLVAAAVMSACGADAAMLEDVSRRTLSAGKLTMEEVWDMVPHEREIAVISVTASQMDEILEQEAALGRESSRLIVNGLSWEQYDDREAGARIEQLRMADGAFIHPRKLLRVAAADVTLASSCGRRPHLRALSEEPSSRIEETGLRMRDAVLAYLQANYPCSGGDGADKP